MLNMLKEKELKESFFDIKYNTLEDGVPYCTRHFQLNSYTNQVLFFMNILCMIFSVVGTNHSWSMVCVYAETKIDWLDALGTFYIWGENCLPGITVIMNSNFVGKLWCYWL